MLVALLLAAGMAFAWQRRRKIDARTTNAPGSPQRGLRPARDPGDADSTDPTLSGRSSETLAEPPAYTTAEIETIAAECYKLAFGVARFDYQVTGEHAEVLERVEATVADAVHRPEYFPRRPMLLPKLLHALNDNESTRRELVRLILEDPSLADSVVRRANSVFYRLSPEPVDSLDRAVRALGTDGLRSLMASAILQPVFRLRPGYFEQFATVTWEQAQRSASAAEAYAKAEGTSDPFAAQLLGLLAALARIVLFRLTMERYREKPNLLPRAEVYIRVMQAHAAPLASLVASTWELPDPSVAALEQQAQRISPADMSALGRAVYFGELGGALAMLEVRGAYSAEGARALLIGQGLTPELTSEVQRAASRAGQE